MNARILAVIIFFILLGIIAYILFTKNESGRKKASSIIAVFSVMAMLLTIIFPEKTAEYIDPNVEQYKSENYSLKAKNEELQSQMDELSEENDKLQKENENLKIQTEPTEEAKSTEGVPFESVLNVLYDGDNYKRYDGENKFSVGGKEYRYGFTVGCDRGIANFGPGYASFNLDGKYSKMSFDVGKVDGYKASATVIVTSQSGINESYPVSADSISEPIEIDLEYTKDLKITVDSDRTVEYGFYNVYLYE